MKSQRDAQEKGLERIARLGTGRFGLGEKLISSNVFLVKLPLEQPMASPLAGVSPFRVDQHLVGPVDEGILGQIEVVAQVGRTTRPMIATS